MAMAFLRSGMYASAYKCEAAPVALLWKARHTALDREREVRIDSQCKFRCPRHLIKSSASSALRVCPRWRWRCAGWCWRSTWAATRWYEPGAPCPQRRSRARHSTASGPSRCRSALGCRRSTETGRCSTAAWWRSARRGACAYASTAGAPASTSGTQSTPRC